MAGAHQHQPRMITSLIWDETSGVSTPAMKSKDGEPVEGWAVMKCAEASCSEPGCIERQNADQTRVIKTKGDDPDEFIEVLSAMIVEAANFEDQLTLDRICMVLQGGLNIMNGVKDIEHASEPPVVRPDVTKSRTLGEAVAAIGHRPGSSLTLTGSGLEAVREQVRRRTMRPA